jgi:hypothetical protein
MQRGVLRAIQMAMIPQQQQRAAEETPEQMTAQQPLEHAAVPSPAMCQSSHLTPHTSHLAPHTSSHLTPHTSHLTPHTSHLTPHTSHLAPHTSSHLTPHTLHLTPHHTSRLTPHTSHLTPHTSHLTPHTSHLTPHTSHLTPHTSHHSPCLPLPPTHQPGSLPAPRRLPTLRFRTSSTAAKPRIAAEKPLSLETTRCGGAMGGRGWQWGCRRWIGGSAALEAAFVFGDFAAAAAAAARILEESCSASALPLHHLHPTTV